MNGRTPSAWGISSPRVVIAFTAATLLLFGFTLRAERIYIVGPGSTVSSFDAAGNVSTVFSNSYLANPYGIAVDPEGNLFVSSIQSNTIVKLDPDGNASIFASTNLRAPHGLAFDDAGNLYVANVSSGSITKFDPSGRSTTIASYPVVSGPNGLAFDDRGNLYAADGNDTIIKFDTNGLSSTFASKTNGIDSPTGICFHKGFLYVANFGLHFGSNTVERLDRNGHATILVARGALEGPSGVMVDDNDNLYVTDQTSRRLIKYDLSDNNATVLTTFPNNQWGPGFMAVPFAPTVRFFRAGNDVVLYWPLRATNYLLETSSGIAPSNTWSQVTNTPVEVGEDVFVTNAVSDDTYFRLHRQLETP